ncbi:DeoR/GlpR transcriptional regulator [Herbaspirillum lusitanum]|uniref:DeoR/GlpR family DNA-binding transcription regulator n=2 Tax=Herbaspirillum lusitanum TaxID=213312 RepID=UPI002237836B|nr:DeoR/GlpR family DNA-binding transcription regulator [Herbaspirillum lusitanum]MCW5298771.1 DeoR/GlpR transcriptional regulator [Herbaspirillum lusitanum]
MLTSQRKKHLLDLLNRDGRIVAKPVSEQLEVSEDTIRRDLRELAREGLLRRVHGGALPLLGTPALVMFANRQHIEPGAKADIGRAAAALVMPGQVVFIDGGTTCVQMARHLAPDLKATVVTHSPSIAVELSNHAHIDVIIIGGKLFKHSVVAMGSGTIDEIARVRADQYFMGVCSLHPRTGITSLDFDEAGIKRAFSRAAADTVVLASPDKLDTTSPFEIVPLAEVSRIVLNRDTAAELIAPYQAQGIEITLA